MYAFYWLLLCWHLVLVISCLFWLAGIKRIHKKSSGVGVSIFSDDANVNGNDDDNSIGDGAADVSVDDSTSD